MGTDVIRGGYLRGASACGTAASNFLVYSCCGRANTSSASPCSTIAALVHHRHPMGQVLDHRQVVADEQVGQSELVLQIQQQVDDAGLDRHVERRHRFVEREDLRLQRQRSCDTDALLLTAGELGGIAAGIGAAQPDGVEQLGHPGLDVASCRNRWPATVPPVCRTPAAADPGRRPDPGRPPAGRGAAPVAARCPGSRHRCRAPRWFPPAGRRSSRISLQRRRLARPRLPDDAQRLAPVAVRS